jgi:flagellar biosynthetic protein FliR
VLVFMAINGHLMIIATLTHSFSVHSARAARTSAGRLVEAGRSGAIIFSAGLLLALPVVVALLITNLALAVLSRAAPQLNLMAIGFPLTIALGFAA